MERQKDQMVGLDGCFASTCVPNFTSALLYQCLTLPAPYCCVFAIEFLRRKRVPHASDAHLERRDDSRAAQRGAAPVLRALVLLLLDTLAGGRFPADGDVREALPDIRRRLAAVRSTSPLRTLR